MHAGERCGDDLWVGGGGTSAVQAAEGVPVETINSEDKRVFAVAIPKAQPGKRWERVRRPI